MKKILLPVPALCVGVLLCLSLRGEAPSRLTTDLAEHTDRVWIGGYPSQVTLEQADKIVGFCRIGTEEDDGEPLGEIVALYLLPQFQRQGIGKQLMQTGIEQLRQRGYSTIVLWVLKSNVQARQFYEHCGFTAEPVEKTLDMGTPQIVVRYRLTCES